MKFVKRPIPSEVTIARQDGILQTLEGPVRFVAGDALMTGITQERWPIDRRRFEATYVPVAPTRMGEDGLYVKKAIPVTAQPVEKATQIAINQGRSQLNASVGDWLVTDETGEQWVVTDEIFRASYRPVEEASGD